jgi:hypothetical protein
MKVTRCIGADGALYGYRFECPGCGKLHVITTTGPHAWGFNGNEERPTFTPSILVYEYKLEDGTIFQPRCHSFVRDGRIEFCTDSDHALAGQTVELPDIDAAEGKGET